MVLFLGLSLFIGNVVADPVADISVVPKEPEPLDSLTFSTTITYENDIDEVDIIIKECNPTLCYRREIVSMAFEEGIYQAEFKLEHSDATYISYHLEITSGDSTFETEEVNLTLKIVSNNGNTNADGSDDSNNGDGSPGFEIIIILAAVFITILYIKKRDRR
jgi:hypothetical protein